MSANLARARLLLLAVGTLAVSACGGEQRAPQSESPAGEAGGTSTGEAGEAAAAPILRGGERVVFVGDSLAVEAPPNYPELLPAALGARAPGVETVNLAEPGATAADWKPGSELFEGRLAPELERADVVVITVGGNDLEEAIGGGDGIDALERAAGSGDAALDAVDRLSRQLQRTFAAVRARAPRAEIVYVGYPDYASATAWERSGGAAGTLALTLGLEALVAAAGAADPDLLVDMREATERAGVDSLLADSEHLGPSGHELYARRLARELTRPQPADAAAGSATSP